MACTQRTLGGIMRIGSLVKCKWLDNTHFGIVEKCTYDMGCRYWRVHWFGDAGYGVFWSQTLEDEEDLEVICE